MEVRMFEYIKTALAEVISIADSCPEKYQRACFESLINSLVKGQTADIGSAGGKGSTGQKVNQPIFFSNHGITNEEWVRVFHFDGTTYDIIAKDLKTKTTSQKQIRLALLLGVKANLENDEAKLSKPLLIELCQKYAAFDSSNFASHMKKGNYFLSRGDGWILTVPGLKAAAEAIKELAQ